MAINISVQYNGGFSLRHYTVFDPRLLPSGNPFKYHVEALSLQPMKRYTIATNHAGCRTTLLFLFCLVSGD